MILPYILVFHSCWRIYCLIATLASMGAHLCPERGKNVVLVRNVLSGKLQDWR